MKQDQQQRFINYLLEIEDTGTREQKEVVGEFLKFFKFGLNESTVAVMGTNGEELYKQIGEMRLNNRFIMMVEDIKEKVNNPKPKGD